MNYNVKPLRFPAALWRSLMLDLRRRGRGYRESGAFLLGRTRHTVKNVLEWLPYDELDPISLHYDYVRLSTESFPRLWNICAERGLEVVGDVHTHPFGPEQSLSDRANPMVSTVGHTALIVPRFAAGDVIPLDVSVNVYLGGGRWSSHFGSESTSVIKLQ